MPSLFVPYSGSEPATIEVKGHRLLILAQRQQFDGTLNLIGADSIKSVRQVGVSPSSKGIRKLADSLGVEVLVPPAETPLWEVMWALERQLPWKQ